MKQVLRAENILEAYTDLLWASGSKATTGPTTIITNTDTHKRVVIDSILLVNGTDNAQVVILAVTAGTPFQTVPMPVTGSGLARSRLNWRMGPGSGISISISSANTVYYSIGYYLEDV